MWENMDLEQGRGQTVSDCSVGWYKGHGVRSPKRSTASLLAMPPEGSHHLL